MMVLQAQRAEVDSRLLLEELQGLMQAKADVAQQRADLDRANTLLMAERELLCEQLDGMWYNMIYHHLYILVLTTPAAIARLLA